MQTETPNNENSERLPDLLQNRIKTLEKALDEAEKRGKNFEKDWSSLYDQNRALREESQKLQHDYETLRIQKGGFGFKTLLASGMGGFLTALLLCFVYIKLKPKPDFVTTFDQFRRENLFNYELLLSKGQFEDVEQSLDKCSHRQEYQLIQPQIYFTQKVVGAAKRRCKEQ